MFPGSFHVFMLSCFRDSYPSYLFRLLLRLLQKFRHVGPQLGERLLFVRREFGQCPRVEDAGQVAVLLPVLQLRLQ